MSDESGNLAIPKIEVDLQLVKRETESPIDLSNCFSTAEVRKLTPTDDQKMKIESLSLDEANVESTTENRNHDYFSDGKNNQKEQVVVVSRFFFENVAWAWGQMGRLAFWKREDKPFSRE